MERKVETQMKKQLVMAALITLGAAAAAYGAAAKGAGVAGSPHDLYSQASYKGNEGQGRICAYCHTPHHAATTGADYLPLWAKDLSQDTGSFFTAYNSSTINNAESGDITKDKAIGPTRLCMSCHDGTVAPDQHYGTVGGTGIKITDDTFGGAGVGSGAAGLTKDHPVGIDYVAVAVGPATGDPTSGNIAAAAGKPQDPFVRNAGALYINNNFGLAISDRLYIASDGKHYMTCATCHDVHNKKNVYSVTENAGVVANYLVLSPQNNSDLCLSCHIK
jgi:hypothetical protein